MTNSKQKKKGKFSLIAGITGAIVGAGAAIAGTLALKDKKNRDKIKKVLNKVKSEIKKDTGKVKRKIAKSSTKKA